MSLILRAGVVCCKACQTKGGWDLWVQAVVRRSVHSTFNMRFVVVC